MSDSNRKAVVNGAVVVALAALTAFEAYIGHLGWSEGTLNLVLGVSNFVMGYLRKQEVP